MNIFEHTKRICLELSNRCPWARFHKRCPLHQERGKPPAILPASIVYHVLDTMREHDYKGMIYFHLFNEPLIDPRLFRFIETTRTACPDVFIHITTNGWYLNQTLLGELAAAGVGRVRVSCYTDAEHKRLKALRPGKMQYVPFRQRALMTGLLPAYDAPMRRNKQRCYAPLQEICVGRDGLVHLCCRDWQHRYSFGDLHTQTLEEILQSEKVQNTYKRLSVGDRFLDICRRCDWTK